MITVWKKPENKDQVSSTDYVLAPHVSLVLADDGAGRLLDMGGGFYALPAIGAQMLQGVLERGSAATVQEIAQRFHVSADRVQADLDALVQQLRKRRLIRNRRHRNLDPGMWLAQSLIPCLYAIKWLTSGWVRTLLMLTMTKLSLLTFGWARTVTVWKQCLGPIPAENAPIDEQKVQTIDKSIQQLASGHLLPMACKERALSSWVLLRWDGVPATLVVGLEFFPLLGHCWCEVGSMVLSDYADNCDQYIPVLYYV